MTNGPALANKAPFAANPVDGYPRMFIDAAAEAAFLAHVDTSPSQEVCGILLGFPGQDEHGYFVHVTRALEGKHADQRGASVTFTHETWDYIHQVIADEKLESIIVGWYHSHPGFGVFYSTHDTFIQQHFFSLPWQVGIVVDPTTGARGAFTNLNKGIQGATCYWRVVPGGPGANAIEPVACVYVDRIAAVDYDERPSPESARVGPMPVRVTSEEALKVKLATAAQLTPHLALLLIMTIMGILSLTHDPAASDTASQPVPSPLASRRMHAPKQTQTPAMPEINPAQATKGTEP